MKELTKAEEQVMRYIWRLEKAFLKDVVEQFPEPRPAPTTVGTVIKGLVKKGFVGFETFGKSNQYYPEVSMDSYSRTSFRGMFKKFFQGNVAKFTSFFASDENLTT